MDKLLSLSSCSLCPRLCGVNRLDGVTGYCGAGAQVRVALAILHPWEEPCISGCSGAGTVFFSHCALRCVFCQNAELSSDGNGLLIDEPRLSEIFLEQQQRGAATLDLVTPTHFAPQILRALSAARENGLVLPVVWNSSGYERAEMIEAISDAIDVFLPDLKYIDEDSARRYSGTPDYFRYAGQAIRSMVQHKGAPRFNGTGIMTQGVMVRHLVLPGRRRESMRILDWLWDEFGDTIQYSLMNQYTPLHQARDYPEINRRLTTFEYQSVVDHALDLGIRNCYVQEESSASAEFVPVFDGRGVT